MTEDDGLITIKLTRKELLVLNLLLTPTITPMTDMGTLADKILDALESSEKQ
jgi:hypothetical protein